MRINTNISAMNTHRQYSLNNAALSKSTEKLSSGYRINSAADDAAGLAISEKMRAQIRGLEMGSRNAQDAVSLVQTAEGYLQDTQDILQRMKDLATQVANGTYDANDREQAQLEYDQLLEQLDYIFTNAEFNGTELFNVRSTTIDASLIQDLGAEGLSGLEFMGLAADTYTALFTDNTDGTVTLTLTGANGNDYEFTIEGDHTGELAEGSYSIKGVGTGTENAGSTATVKFNVAGGTSTNNDNYINPSDLDNLTGSIEVTVENGPNSLQMQVGYKTANTMSISLTSLDITNISSDLSGLSAVDLTTLSISTQEDANAAIDSLYEAIQHVSAHRATMGAYQNRLEYQISSLDNAAENLSAAESRIRDVDMASEMTEYTKQSILAQAATAMLAQANSQPQLVLQLLG